MSDEPKRVIQHFSEYPNILSDTVYKNIYLQNKQYFDTEVKYAEFVVDDRYTNDNKQINNFHIESNILKFVAKNYLNPDTFYAPEHSIGDITEDIKLSLKKELNRCYLIDIRNNKKYQLNNTGKETWTQNVFSLYKLLKHICGDKYTTTIEITEQDIENIQWTNDKTGKLKSLVKNNSDDIQKLIYCAINLFQNLVLNYAHKFYGSNNIISQFSSDRIFIIDIINDQPYITMISNITYLYINHNLIITYAYFLQFNPLNYIEEESPKVLLQLLHKPNIKQTILQDSMHYLSSIMDNYWNLNIFRCLFNEPLTQQSTFLKTAKDRSYRPYIPKLSTDDAFENLSCSAYGGKNKDNPRCTYNGLLKNVDYLTDKHCYDIDGVVILNEINRFISNEKFKYLPVCFIFSIDENTLIKLFRKTHNPDIPYIIEIIKTTVFLRENVYKEEIVLPSTVNFNLPEYQKVIFIVNTQYEETFPDSMLSIEGMKSIIKNKEVYKDLCNCEEHIPVLVSSYLARNILTVSLLYSILNFNQSNPFMKIINNFEIITRLHCIIAFSRFYNLEEIRYPSPNSNSIESFFQKIEEIENGLMINGEKSILNKYIEELKEYVMINALPIDMVNYIINDNNILRSKNIFTIDPAPQSGGVKKSKYHNKYHNKYRNKYSNKYSKTLNSSKITKKKNKLF